MSNVRPSSKNCPSAICASAVDVVCGDVDVSGTKAVYSGTFFKTLIVRNMNAYIFSRRIKDGVIELAKLFSNIMKLSPS
jgi:hypothetical protein